MVVQHRQNIMMIEVSTHISLQVCYVWHRIYSFLMWFMFIFYMMVVYFLCGLLLSLEWIVFIVEIDYDYIRC